VLLDRSRPVHLVVVGEALVVLGNEAEGLGTSQLIEHVKAKMIVQKGAASIVPVGRVLLKNDQRLDHAEFADRCEQSLILLPFSHFGARCACRKDLPDRHHLVV